MSFPVIERYSYDDYLQWEGNWELIDGLPLAMAPSPMRIHQNIAYELARYLRNEIEEYEKCEVVGGLDYKISEDTILKPDVVLTCRETNQTHLTKAPEIVIEVISKTSAKRDEVYKYEIYEEEKVKYYLLVYPEDLKAKIYKLKDGKYDKIGDFLDTSYTFDEAFCKPTLDFKKVFKRFRK